MSLEFLIEIGFLRIDCAIAKNLGELEKAEDLMIDSYFLVHKKAFIDGCTDTQFDIDSFLTIYPEYDADYYHHYYLGRQKEERLNRLDCI